jgi:dihydroflavonol-4-reductase
MLAFVTGSTGLLGNNLVHALFQAGHEVRALARSTEKAQRELGDTAARIIVGDVRNVAEFAYGLRGIDVVFHTAAYFREYYNPGDHSNAVELTNVRATMELAQTAHAMGVGKMIYTSSASIIGLQPDGSPGDEQTPSWPGTARNLYLKSKGQAEQLLREFSRENQFFVAAVLPSWMWGPHDAGPTPSGKLVFDAIAHRLPPMLPPGGSAVVDARDVAVGMLRVAEIGRSGERYILSGDFAEVAGLIVNLAALTGAKPPRKHIPFAAAVALATASETWSRITGTPSPLSVEAVRLMNARLRVTSAKAEKDLGVTFRPFNITLADTVAWARTRLEDTSDTEVADSVINSKKCLSGRALHPYKDNGSGTDDRSRAGSIHLRLSR